VITVDGVGAAVMRLDRVRTQHRWAAAESLTKSAVDVRERERVEVQRVFDRPTPLVKNAFRLKKKATKTDLEASVWIKDVYGRDGEALLNTLTPHIPGRPRTRAAKGMERALRLAGLLKPTQYLVPSRTMRLNRYGNVTGKTASKMLNDLHAFAGVSGFTSETGERKRKYMWGTVKTRSGGQVSGIWDEKKLRKGTPGGLMMLAVDKTPAYRKRFQFYLVAHREFDRVFSGRYEAAKKKYLKR
jgi:hypothetical protein